MLTRPTNAPTSPRVSISPPTTAQEETHTPDWSNIVTSLEESWNNYTKFIPAVNSQEKMTQDFSLGSPIASLMLMLLMCALAIMGK
ncbi:hepatitis A virus cellular receptor 1 homolog [Phodopus roborovskii]|uniref:hepatitis A virus cellular receptor 1 homolog n=1 Tax=Phodopus roborovskii TaxID=109678 RepID=UPI0021E4771F|nr:hepatitis A virus cellular receptor 1 homolog [Phodopus roborovskii]